MNFLKKFYVILISIFYLNLITTAGIQFNRFLNYLTTREHSIDIASNLRIDFENVVEKVNKTLSHHVDKKTEKVDCHSVITPTYFENLSYMNKNLKVMTTWNCNLESGSCEESLEIIAKVTDDGDRLTSFEKIVKETVTRYCENYSKKIANEL